MDATTIVLSVVVAVVIVLIFIFIFRNGAPSVFTPSVGITESTATDGRKTFNSKVDLPKSFNEKEGMAFSFTCWVRVNDWNYRYGAQKVIFTKGPTDLSSSCPSLLLDGNTNSLLVKLDTFGATEIIPISNIPAKKWIHIAIAVNQDAVNVYVNGTLHTYHTLAQLPRQNSDTVHTGIDGGFDGKIAAVEYYNRFLSPSDVKATMKTVPQADPEDAFGPTPPYFDITWWTRS